MAITDYASLQAHVADTLARTDLTDQIKVFIQMVEASLDKLPYMTNRTSATLSIDAQDVLLPTDAKRILSLAYDGSAIVFGSIDLVTPERGMDFLGSRGFGTAQGYPRVAFYISDHTLRFVPIPDNTYTAQLIYEQGVPTLSTSQTTNWLLTSHPDVYFAAVMAEAEVFLKNYEGASYWQQILSQRLEALRARKARDVSSLNSMKMTPKRALGV